MGERRKRRARTALEALYANTEYQLEDLSDQATPSLEEEIEHDILMAEGRVGNIELELEREDLADDEREILESNLVIEKDILELHKKRRPQ